MKIYFITAINGYWCGYKTTNPLKIEFLIEKLKQEFDEINAKFSKKLSFTGGQVFEADLIEADTFNVEDVVTVGKLGSCSTFIPDLKNFYAYSPVYMETETTSMQLLHKSQITDLENENVYSDSWSQGRFIHIKNQ